VQPIKHDLRLSETVAPYGVGAIVDVRGESLIAPDTSWWDRKFAARIFCDRLTSRLGAGELRQAPTHAGRAAKDTASLMYWRFPAWRFCERCSSLSMLTGREKGRYVNKCECGGMLVPMRYVAICKGGSHVMDIPWFMWAHRGHDKGVTDEVRFCRGYSELKFIRSTDKGEGLASLRVICNKCKRSRPLTDLVRQGALRADGIKCGSRQPWEDEAAVKAPCESPLIAVQRGATGNYIAERLSALDIPEAPSQSEQMAAKVRGHVYFEKVVADNGGPQAELVAGWIAEELNIPRDTVLRIAADEDADNEAPILDIKDGEWSAFVDKLSGGRDRSVGDFVVDGWSKRSEFPGPNELTRRIAGIGQVHRVREVQALLGFRRHDPGAAFIKADLGPDSLRNPIYPSIELFGEGIFLRFDEDAISAWESQSAVQDRADILVKTRENAQWAHRLDVPEPRYIALHTIAHLLIRRLAFASGYTSAALQERIYANSSRADRTAGILIYTAAGDAQGTLGGLVRLGQPARLIPLLIAALDEADVCSNDPVCIESDRQVSSRMNLSACHGCALISETSCEVGNRLLDRRLVLGGNKVPGFLEAVLPQIREAAQLEV
jgi:hypothetical protein